MGGTGLEPVTPSLSSRSSRSLAFGRDAVVKPANAPLLERPVGPAFVRDGIPRTSRSVCGLANTASRPHPARDRRKLPARPGNPRNARLGKARSRRQSPPIPAPPGSTMTGLSRRRSRVRVPSLPSPETPAPAGVCGCACRDVSGMTGCRIEQRAGWLRDLPEKTQATP